jgi:hypothetical protein
MTPFEYRRKAQQFLNIARTCSDPRLAARLRVMAADYFDRAEPDGNAAPVLQQQHQPPQQQGPRSADKKGH